MGARYTKAVGYGFIDLQLDADGKLIDPRINLQSPFLSYQLHKSALEDYLPWLQSQVRAKMTTTDLDYGYLRDLQAGQVASNRRVSVEDALIYSGEESDGNVLLLRPLSCPDWERRDDILDYIQLGLDSPDYDPYRVEVLRNGIYPFNLYMDSRTGEQVDHAIMNWIRATAPDAEYRSDLDELAQRAGFADHAEAQQFCRPMVPADIRNLARYGELFSSEEVWLQMQPIFYCFTT